MHGVRWFLALLAVGGCADGVALSVDVKTDFVPGAEFAAVRVSLVGEGSTSTVGAAGDYLRGERAVDLSGLEANSARVVSVELLDSLGGVVAERSALVDHREDRGITMALARDCAGVSCPGAGAAAATACFGGRCADPECIDGTEPVCPEPECRVNTDCPALDACSSRRCIGTLCLYAPQVGACEAGFYCSPEAGCLALPTPVDAMPMDAGPGDAGTDAEMDAGTDAMDASVPPLSVPRPTWPQNGAATGASTLLGFHWSASSTAETYDFELRSACPVDMSMACTSPAAFEMSVDNTELDVDLRSFDIDATPIGRRYRWRVRACRGIECSDWSDERYLEMRRGPSDFDGDGTDEMVVGSVAHASVFEYNGANFVAVQELTTPFADRTSGFGESSQVGDLNGDGYADAVIGARYDRGFGSVAIYHGGPSGLVLVQRIENPPSSPLNNFFSRSLCIADFDADGFGDLAVGGGSGTYIYGGSEAGIVPTLVAEVPGRLDSCADINEDGLADVVNGGNYFPGHATMLVQTTAVALPSVANYYVGDVNGDGFADFTAGNSGNAQFMFGNAGGLDAAVAMTGAAGGILSFDYQALGLADLNGDGFSDVVMGDVQSDSRFPGIVAFSLGSSAAIGPRLELLVQCTGACNRRGYALTYGFDLNDDGFGDAVTSANDEEAVFVFWGGLTGLNPSALRVTRSQPMFDRFGVSL